MLKKAAIVALLGLAGMGGGVAVTGLAGQRYLRNVEIVLPPGTNGNHVVALTSGEHPGVRVYAMKNFVWAGATGSLDGTADAVGAAVREVIANNHGKVKAVMRSFGLPQRRPLGNLVHYGLLGLLAGLSAAFGFLVPSSSRVTAMSA
jgi:hypothetical protein